MVQAQCVLHTKGYILTICSICCFSTTTVIARTRLSITLHVHCVSCWKCLSLYPSPRILCLCLWFRASLIYINNCPTRCNTKIILQVHSTCFGCQINPSSGVHKIVTAASGSVQLPPSNVAKLVWTRWREVAAKNMTSTGGCSYSFVYSWWWVWLTPETCRVNLQNNK